MIDDLYSPRTSLESAKNGVQTQTFIVSEVEMAKSRERSALRFVSPRFIRPALELIGITHDYSIMRRH
jgi:hypothetical protein